MSDEKKMDFGETYIIRKGTHFIRCCDLDPVFKLQKDLAKIKKKLVWTIILNGALNFDQARTRKVRDKDTTD